MCNGLRDQENTEGIIPIRRKLIQLFFSWRYLQMESSKEDITLSHLNFFFLLSYLEVCSNQIVTTFDTHLQHSWYLQMKLMKISFIQNIWMFFNQSDLLWEWLVNNKLLTLNAVDVVLTMEWLKLRWIVTKILSEQVITSKFLES